MDAQVRAGLITIACVMLLAVWGQGAFQGLAVQDTVTLHDQTPVDSLGPKTRHYLKNFGITQYRGRLHVPDRVQHVPFPRIGEREQITQELLELERAGRLQ